MSREKIPKIVSSMVIGVSGKACSGKDRVCMILEKYGSHVIHADAIGWTVLNEKIDEIYQIFGDSILNVQGYIDRKKLGDLVFSNSFYLKSLNNITHPHIVKKIRNLLQNYSKNEKIILNAALLPYFDIPEINAVIWVKSHFLMRLLRSLSRDKRSLFFVLKRMWSQRKLSPKLFSKKVDVYEVVNVQDLFLLERRIRCVAKSLGFGSVV